MSITFDTAHQAAHRRGNRRKAVRTIGLLCRRSEGTPPESLFTNGNELVDLAAEGFEYAGLVTEDGYNFQREDSVDGTPSQGFLDNTREDLTSSESTVVVTFQETKKRVLQEIFDGADYRDAEVTTTGELVRHKPAFPNNEEWILVVIYMDGAGDNAHLTGKVYPTLQAQSVGGEQWNNEALSREVTFKAFVDDELGVKEIELDGGAGFVADAGDLGWAEGN